MANDDDDAQVCKVYDKHDFFTFAVQMFLAVLALGSLYIKRMQEHPQRTLRTWFLDVSKQAFGAGYAHVLNMIIAAVISKNGRGETVLEDQCAWYGMSYIIDTTLGLLLAIVFLQWLDQVANARDWYYFKHSGVYTGSDAWIIWSFQVCAWLLILTIVKLLIYLFMWISSKALATVGGILFAPLQGNIRFELVFVMVLFPGVLNVIYFWIADSFLKAKKDQEAAFEHDELQDKRESLMETEATIV